MNFIYFIKFINLNKFPNDNLNYNNNVNSGNNNLINEDKELEFNRNQYLDGMKEEIPQNQSQRIEDQERISDKIYKDFLVKVYGILSVQLFIILFFILLFQKDSIKSYFLFRPIFTWFLIIISAIGFLFTLFLLSNNDSLGKRIPYNYLTLLIITLFMSLDCGLFAVNCSFSVVLFCILLSVISSITITIYAY